jgi:hypothetical protein
MVFPADLLTKAVSSGRASTEKRYVAGVLTTRWRPHINIGRRFDMLNALGRKDAWLRYLVAAKRCGLISEPGDDIVRRLRELEGENFRSAMAECIAAWFLSSELGLDVGPRPEGRPGRTLDLSLSINGTAVGVEVKAPRRELREGVWGGDDSDLVEGALAKANGQFNDVEPNLLVLVPEVVPPFYSRRLTLINALIGHQVIAFSIDKETGEAVVEPHAEFRADGKMARIDGRLSRPRHTRVSAVLCLEEFAKSSIGTILRKRILLAGSIGIKAMVLHNPYARNPLNPALFSICPQLIPRDGKMVWTS